MSEKSQQPPRTTLKFGRPVGAPTLVSTANIDAQTHAHTCSLCGLVLVVIYPNGTELHLNERDGANCRPCALALTTPPHSGARR